MPLFQIGDLVERVGPLVPVYLKHGRIVRVIPHPALPEYLTEYEVDFTFLVGNFYQTQLRLAEGHPQASSPPN
jgi:hypothetical protein